MEENSATVGYDLMFSNKLIKRLLGTTRVLLLQYYREADIVPTLEVLEKEGKDLEKLGFMEAIDEFELRGVNRLAPFAPWLTVKNKKHG
jgi:hypothetical protein